ncbi:MAG: hypothetical protein R3C28_29075 [Pirellulaceae bacterium]
MSARSVVAQTIPFFWDETGFYFDMDQPSERLTTLQIVSHQGIFVGERPETLSGLFDVFHSHKLFKLDPAGFVENFGFVFSPMLTAEQLAADLCFDGSYVGGGSFDSVTINGLAVTGCELAAQTSGQCA